MARYACDNCRRNARRHRSDLRETQYQAAESQYDRKVCVLAVGTARDVFMRVPIEGTATEHGQAVLKALEPLCDNYNDPDGEYTSGKGSIGDVFYDIMGVVKN